MIFNFGSISDLYNRIKLVNTRVDNTEAVDVAQNNRMTNIESVNTAQNTRLTNIESKLITSTKELSNYVDLYSGYSFGSGSYIRMYGNVVDMYLNVNGRFTDTANSFGRINNIRPYSSGIDLVFTIFTEFTIVTTLSINTSNGIMSVALPRSYFTDNIKVHMVYLT